MLSYNQLINYNFSQATNSYNDNALVKKNSATKLIALLNYNINPNEYILDLGSGLGTFKHLNNQKEYISKPKMILYDLNINMLKAATNSNRINGDASILPFSDQSINLVISNFMLQWVPNKIQTLIEIYRVLKPGGIGVISVLIKPSFFELSEALGTANYNSHMLNFLLTKDYLQLIHKVGFELLRKEEVMQILYFSDIYELLKHFKLTGTAMNKFVNFKGLGAKKIVSQLNLAYSKYKTELGLPLSYSYLILMFQKG